MIGQLYYITFAIAALAVPTGTDSPVPAPSAESVAMGCGVCVNTNIAGEEHHNFDPDGIGGEFVCVVGGHQAHDCENGDGTKYSIGTCEATHAECFGGLAALTLLEDAHTMSLEAVAERVEELGGSTAVEPGHSRIRIMDCGGGLVGIATVATATEVQ